MSLQKLYSHIDHPNFIRFLKKEQLVGAGNSKKFFYDCFPTVSVL